MSHDVFICHSSKDRTLANAICARLEANRIRCWIAPRDVVPGVEYAQSIIEAIAATHLTVLVFSDNANQSPHVHRELERTASHGIPILPFRVEDVVPAPSVEYFISDAHWLDAITPPMEQHLDYLVGTVRLILDREAAKAGHPPHEDADAERLVTPPAAPAPMRRSTRRYAALGGAALLVVTAVVAGVLALSGGTDTAQREPSTTGTTSPTGTTSSAAAGGQATSFVDEFDGTLGEGWAWENEDEAAWALDGGALRIDLQTSPPLRNVLLRATPAGDFTATTQIEFDPKPSDEPPTGGPSRFAGLVLTGDDPQTRLEFCWSSDGLSLMSWVNGDIRDGSQISADQFTKDEWKGAELSLEVSSGYYTAVFSSQTTPNWEIDTKMLDASFDRVGLIASTTEEANGETAAFTRFVVE